jgi:hypothetical protein
MDMTDTQCIVFLLSKRTVRQEIIDFAFSNIARVARGEAPTYVIP